MIREPGFLTGCGGATLGFGFLLEARGTFVAALSAATIIASGQTINTARHREYFIVEVAGGKRRASVKPDGNLLAREGKR
jgi:hypothetical protein